MCYKEPLIRLSWFSDYAWALFPLFSDEFIRKFRHDIYLPTFDWWLSHVVAFCQCFGFNAAPPVDVELQVRRHLCIYHTSRRNQSLRENFRWWIDANRTEGRQNTHMNCAHSTNPQYPVRIFRFPFDWNRTDCLE